MEKQNEAAWPSSRKHWQSRETNKHENGKALGQPISAKVDETLKKSGADRAAQLGGTIEEGSEDTLTLMEKVALIIEEMVKRVLQAPTGFAGADAEI